MQHLGSPLRSYACSGGCVRPRDGASEELELWRPVDYYACLKQLDAEGDLADFDPLFLHLAVAGISDFFITVGRLVELFVPPGTDLNDLGRQYEAFVEKLLLDGLRKR